MYIFVAGSLLLDYASGMLHLSILTTSSQQLNVDTGPWHVKQIVFQSEERSAVLVQSTRS